MSDNNPDSKKLLLSIPKYMYKEIEMMQPYIGTTITGTIITLLDHGLAYERKKAVTTKKQKQQLGLETKNPNEATADQEEYKTKDQIAQEHGYKDWEEYQTIIKAKWI